ncbi:OPT oligopeptide transporter [Lentinus tigrinus ALCF2SS1-7]|uniref:OPT oligopeptide transporter n=1 Tax=Lentinus tigrinus ALCF2SS1-6 TaxID=1328759 RepID=A0A5C2RQ03_9APHY|nr:OPT oligopeptide transporter [Lentinus tigrinus ALCF2SS1-6]RPD79670.1 OPT oligopeptide transporter [Lentinus tigrinus ALCF2SS1-7]
MATIERKASDASVDEKAHEADLSLHDNVHYDNLPALAKADANAIGDVSDDVRAIDLDASGHERPIETEQDYALRLVSLDDDPTLPIHTFRTWFLGLGLACFAAVLGELFYFRPQTVQVSGLFLQVFAFLLGRGLEIILPGPNHPRFQTRDNWFWRFINPGPFNIKEHVAISIMSTTASDQAIAISVFAAQDLYYNITINPAIAIFTLIASQLIGYGLAGLARDYLVYPTWAVYPFLMPQVQLFDAMHRGKGIFLQRKRRIFFWAVLIAIFVWEWFPEYIAPTLTGVSIFCLAAQHSAWVTRIFGGAAGNEGLGLFALSLDWNYVGAGGGAIGSLFTPLATQLSLYAGVVVCILSFCFCYYRNVWHAQNFPFLSQLLFYEDGREYDQLAILNDDFTLNTTKLEQQGLPYYAASQTLYQLSRTAYIGTAVTHFFIWHFKDVWNIVRNVRTKECDDVHYQKMKVYKEVPLWWFGVIFVITFALGLGLAYAAKSGLPWWGFIVALIFSTAFVPILGTLYATVGYQPSLQFLIQMVGGAMIPGRPVANMYFTLYGFQTYQLTLNLLRDLKLGQYTKLPPRVTFVMQTVGGIIGGVLNYVIMQSVISGNREILLAVQGTNVWSGQQVQSYNSNAITWGALAKPLYAPGARYGFIPWMLIAGLAVPIPFYIAHRLWPKAGFNYVFTPVVVAELGYLSVGINSSWMTSLAIAIFSQWYLRKYRPRWFRKYNFLLSAALDGGTQIMVFVYSFAVGGASGKAVPFPNWGLNPKGNPDYCLRLSD